MLLKFCHEPDKYYNRNFFLSSLSLHIHFLEREIAGESVEFSRNFSHETFVAWSEHAC